MSKDSDKVQKEIPKSEESPLNANANANENQYPHPNLNQYSMPPQYQYSMPLQYQYSMPPQYPNPYPMPSPFIHPNQYLNQQKYNPYLKSFQNPQIKPKEPPLYNPYAKEPKHVKSFQSSWTKPKEPLITHEKATSFIKDEKSEVKINENCEKFEVQTDISDTNTDSDELINITYISMTDINIDKSIPPSTKELLHKQVDKAACQYHKSVLFDLFKHAVRDVLCVNLSDVLINKEFKKLKDVFSVDALKIIGVNILVHHHNLYDRKKASKLYDANTDDFSLYCNCFNGHPLFKSKKAVALGKFIETCIADNIVGVF